MRKEEIVSGLDVFALIVLIVLLVVAIAALIGLGMLPGKIAKQRNHPQADAINVAGWLGVLSLGILYPLGLIWAFTKPQPDRGTDATNEDTVRQLVERVEALEKRPPNGRSGGGRQ